VLEPFCSGTGLLAKLYVERATALVLVTGDFPQAIDDTVFDLLKIEPQQYPSYKTVLKLV
jgi:hypothetical protein